MKIEMGESRHEALVWRFSPAAVADPVVVAMLPQCKLCASEDARRIRVMRGLFKSPLRELVNELHSCEMDADFETMAPITVRRRRVSVARLTRLFDRPPLRAARRTSKIPGSSHLGYHQTAVLWGGCMVWRLFQQYRVAYRH